MPRVLIPPGALQGDTAIVTDPRELHHLLHVLRVKPGDRLECFDGAGRRAWGRVSRCTAKELVVALERIGQEPATDLHVTLAHALIKPDRFDWAVQKATELGVNRIVPLITQRTTVRLPADGADRKVARWERIVREAAKQCGCATLPLVESPQRFADFASGLDTGGAALLATLEAPTTPIAEALEPLGRQLTLLIGPEGDFTREEVLLGQRHGAKPVSLGVQTLRSETAAVAALAMVRYQQMMDQRKDS